MEISTQVMKGVIEIRLEGRLDASWADHLSQTLEETMRAGHHHIRLNMTGVGYLSSLGIRVLVTYYKKVQAVGGTFAVSSASDHVQNVLELVGLKSHLITSASAAPTGAADELIESRTIESEGASFEIFDLSAERLQCELVGNPELLNGCRFSHSDCRPVQLPETSFGFGLGALGADFAQCSTRFGEFLAVAGAAAYQPSDGSNAPDIQLAEGTLVPEMQVLYGAIFKGTPGILARFESKPKHGAVGLAELAETALEISGADRAGIVGLAESAGLVGASLRRPPVNGVSASAPFEHPEIRNWLSFTTERAFSREVAVVVGLAARNSDRTLAGILRPLKGNGTQGHFHAAAFSYRPLQKGRIDLCHSIRTLFEQETLLGIMHLIGDDRDAVGVAESEFLRGAWWIGPVADPEGRQT